ncbi:MAG: metallophosphoesterase family protein [Akkermansiaceae bacterium]
MSRKLAIGDVHGCLKSLKKLLKLVKPEAGDRVIMLGDYVDRGPSSRGVIEYLLDWPWEAELICLKGNHEMIMEDAVLSEEHFAYWCDVGGIETVVSYDARFEDIPKKHWKFIRGGLPYYETKKYIFVHGGVDPKVPMEEQDQDELSWRRFPNAKKHCSGKTVICGHTIQRRGIPVCKRHTVCIDTAACRGGWLTCFDVKSRHYWQANEKGKTREGILKKRAKRK